MAPELKPGRAQQVKSRDVLLAPRPVPGLLLGLVFGFVITLGSGFELAARTARDLDVDVPPGSPLSWAGALPASTPWKGSLLPSSGGEALGGSRTLRRREASATSSRGALRVLTWDIEGHLDWIGRGATVETGRSSWEVPLPRAGSALYWVCLIPFLRDLLHPAAVFETELAAHLIELGRPVLAVLPAVSGEAGLAGLAASVESRVRPEVDHSPALLATRTPREAMFARFAFEELLLVHPFDPDYPFAGRLLLFPEEAERWARDYANHGSASLRRAAIALLARLRSADAERVLHAHALSTEDPVVLHRALGALGQRGAPGDTAPLVERFEAAQGPARLAWIDVLGRLRSRAALPALLKAGEAALEHGADELPTIIEALARIPARDPEPILDFAEHVSRTAQSSRNRFRLERSKARVVADVPDPPTWRARCVEVLAVGLRARLRGEDSTPARRLLEWLGKSARRAPTGIWYENKALKEIPARSRRFYIESLRFLGADGARALMRLADDPGLEPNLRLDALLALERPERMERCLTWLSNTDEPLELRIGAVQLLRGDPDKAYAEVMRALVAQAALPGSAAKGTALNRSPAARRLVSEALLWLEAGGFLTLEDLEPLFTLLEDPRWTHGSFPEELRADVRDLIRLAADAPQAEVIAQAVDALVVRTRLEAINPNLDEASAPGIRNYIIGQVTSVPAHKSDPAYTGLVEDLVTERLLGYGPPKSEEQVPFRQRVPLEEQLVLTLGKLEHPAATFHLRKLLDNRRHVLRAYALLALGWKAEREDLRLAATYLLDGEAFVRLCASEAARSIADREVDVDWMFGKSAERAAAAEEILRWTLKDR